MENKKLGPPVGRFWSAEQEDYAQGAMCVCRGGVSTEEEHLPGTNPVLASHFTLENCGFIKLQ